MTGTHAPVSGHGEALPEFGDDICRCPLCRALDARDGLPPMQQQRPWMRGPVQDESGRLDPMDAEAMAAVERGQRPDMGLIEADRRCDTGGRR